MVCFQTKNTNLGKFWRALDWKMFAYCMPIWNILWTWGIFYDYSVHFVFIWYIFSGFGIMYQEKSGNPAPKWLQSCWQEEGKGRLPKLIETPGRRIMQRY
jgi:hypothetical protein